MKQRSLSVVLVLLVVGAVGAPRSAFADAKTVQAIERKNREAMENYDLLDYEAAKKGLNEAIALAKRKKLDKHPVRAQTHLYLGIVEFSGFGDKESALLQFMDAVDIDPKVDIPAADRTGELSEMLDQARSEGGSKGGGDSGGGDGGGGDDAGIDCSSLMGMSHELVDEAAAGADKKVDAYVAADVKASKVSLYYRPQGENLFVEVPMTKSGDCHFSGVIPGDVLKGEFMHYYVAAENSGGKTVASKGSAGSPNIIEIQQASGGGGGGFDEGGGAFDDENPLAGGGGRKKKKKRSSGSSSSSSSVSGSVDVGPKKSKYFLSLALGSGGGYVTGDTESTGNEVACCFAPALFHVFPELGYKLDDQASISAAFRVGFPIGANIRGHSTGAPAALLRYRRALDPSGDGLAISGGIGGGILRNTVKLADQAVPEMGMDTDTVALGPLLVSAGLAYTSALGGPMRFLFEVNSIAGIPVIDEFACADPNDKSTCVHPQFGVQFDINLGLIFAF